MNLDQIKQHPSPHHLFIMKSLVFISFVVVVLLKNLYFPLFSIAMLQVHQDRVYQEHVATKAKERAIQMEQYYEQLLNRIQAEANCIRNFWKMMALFHNMHEKILLSF